MKTILVIGDSCHDIYHYGECDRLSPEAPVPIFKEIKQVSKFGMSLNVAENLKTFGFNVIHLTNQEIITKHRFVDTRSKQHLLRVDRGEQKKLSRINLKEIKLNCNVDAVVISDYNKGFLSSNDCTQICSFYKSLDIPVFVDSKKKELNCFNDCWLKINEKEYLTSKTLPLDSNILITLGSKGAKYMDKIYPTDSVEVFDVCGAGDIFLSAFVSSYLDTKEVESAINFANKFASLSVTKFGTYVIIQKDIERILNE